MDSIGFSFQRIEKHVVLALLTLSLAGCAIQPTASTTAPRSNVSRVQALTQAKQLAANIGGTAFVLAPSGSMLPILDEGSIVTVEKVKWDRLKKGDIVVYRNSSGRAVIHRLYEQHNEHWFVLGDNNSSIDRETVFAANLLGRVCAIFYTSADTVVTSTDATSAETAIASSH